MAERDSPVEMPFGHVHPDIAWHLAKMVEAPCQSAYATPKVEDPFTILEVGPVCYLLGEQLS